MKNALTVVISITAVIASLPGIASAGTCKTPGCGGIVWNNTGNAAIKVANDWCWGISHGIYHDTETLRPCVKHPDNPESYHADVYIGPYDTSYNYPHYYDTDAFRVNQGCAVTYRRGNMAYKEDRRGFSHSRWIKISNWDSIYIDIIECGHE